MDEVLDTQNQCGILKETLLVEPLPSMERKIVLNNQIIGVY